MTKTHLSYELKKKKLEPAIIWKLVTCQRITPKNTRPRWVDTWAHDTIGWYCSADTLFWQLSIYHNIDVQSVFSWATKLARKCESKHWYACGADGGSVGRAYGHVITKLVWLPNFLGWVDYHDFLGMGIRPRLTLTVEFRYNKRFLYSDNADKRQNSQP